MAQTTPDHHQRGSHCPGWGTETTIQKPPDGNNPPAQHEAQPEQPGVDTAINQQETFYPLVTGHINISQMVQRHQRQYTEDKQGREPTEFF